ncbi:MAG: transglutaminase domain-containing protein [Myxococcales bacterium]|nr:transglutaminase domain-containing protein [Myxococcales bacterium]
MGADAWPAPSAAEGPYLSPTFYLDSDHPEVRAFALRAAQGDEVERAVRLFYAVRDGIRYDPYCIRLVPEDYRASAVLERGQGFCVQKAILLAAAARASGIPSRLAFADVRNHLTTPRLLELMGTDVFVFHGLTHLYLEGRWLKATPTFDIGLCRRFCVRPLDFDGKTDAVFQPFDPKGQRHMEYLRDRGHAADFDLAQMEAAFREAYPRLFLTGAAPGGDFLSEIPGLTDR